jgi:hypothetical protein
MDRGVTRWCLRGVPKKEKALVMAACAAAGCNAGDMIARVVQRIAELEPEWFEANHPGEEDFSTELEKLNSLVSQQDHLLKQLAELLVGRQAKCTLRRS